MKLYSVNYGAEIILNANNHWKSMRVTTPLIFEEHQYQSEDDHKITFKYNNQTIHIDHQDVKLFA
jgi:hypothetical protein